MEYTVDLHNHTPLIPTDYATPGTTPDDLVAAALAAGIDVLGITDHSSVAYFRQVERAAAGAPLLVVPGAELKVRHAGDEVHMIVLLPPESAEAAFDAVRERFGIDPATPAGELPNVIVQADPVEVARLAVSLGGTCHAGHVDRSFGDYRLIDRPLMAALAEAPLCAVELVDCENLALLPEWARALTILCSSDAHAPDQMGRRTCRLELEEPSFEALRAALAVPRAAVR